MSGYVGDFTAGKTVRLSFNTHSTAGVPTSLLGTPSLACYKDGGTTESTAGVTLTVDFDARTGLNLVAIDTSADGTFYGSGSDFRVVITAGTVGGQSVAGTVVGSFSLSNRSALRPTTADRTLDVSSGGEAGLDWANVGSPTTAVNLSATTVGTVTTLAGHTPQTGDAYARLGAPAGASISADLAEMRGATFDTSTDSLEALRNRGDAAWVTATGFSTLDAAGVRGAIGMATANLDTQLGAIDDSIDTEIAAIKAKTDNLPAAFPTNFATLVIAADGVVAAEGRTRTLQAGTTTSLTLAASEPAVDDARTGWLAWLVGGTGAGQLALINDYVGSTRVATVVDATTGAALATAPDGTTTYQLIPPSSIVGSMTTGSDDVATAVVDAFGVRGTVNDASPTASGFAGDTGLSSTGGFYVGAVLAFRSGTLDGIARKITGYTGATRTFAFATAFPAAPANGDSFVILGRID